MASEQNITEEQNIIEEIKITEEQNIIEEQSQKITEELNNISVSDPDPPNQPSMISLDNGQAENDRTEQGWPMHERCVRGEINDICVPLDKSEVFFRIADPFEQLPPSNDYFRDVSELEHLFTPLMDCVEEMNDSPCRSPTSKSL